MSCATGLTHPSAACSFQHITSCSTLPSTLVTSSSSGTISISVQKEQASQQCVAEYSLTAGPAWRQGPRGAEALTAPISHIDLKPDARLKQQAGRGKGPHTPTGLPSVSICPFPLFSLLAWPTALEKLLHSLSLLH